MCCLLLVCAVLKTLHFVNHILNEEECRSVGKAAKCWWHDLAVVIATKPSGAVQETLGVLEEYKRALWYDITAERIKCKLYLGISLCIDTLLHTSDLTLHSLTVHCMWSE